jgi:hypothetical protein
MPYLTLDGSAPLKPDFCSIATHTLDKSRFYQKSMCWVAFTKFGLHDLPFALCSFDCQAQPQSRAIDRAAPGRLT